MKSGLTDYERRQTRSALGREPIPHGEYSSADIELGRKREAQLIAEARRVALGYLIEKARAGGVFLPASIPEMLL